MTTQCAACSGTTKLVTGGLGGVLLCREHLADVEVEIKKLRSQGKQVNVMAIARRMFREEHSAGDYLLRDIPEKLWLDAKHRAVNDGVSLRELILEAVERYLK